MDPDLARAIREGFLTVTIASSGGQIVFARGSEFRILDGVEGFGPAPVEYTSTPLPGGGGVRRHSRHAENSLFLPIELRGSSPDHLRRLRRELEGVILADGAGTAVTVQVEDSEGVRTQEAFLDGEGHSYSLGGAASHFTWHKIGLTLTAPVPWWFGPQREAVWALSPKRTAFLSHMRDEPSTPRLVRTNHVLNPSVVGTDARAYFTGSVYQGTLSSSSTEQPHFGPTSWRLETTDTEGDRIGGRLDTDAEGTMRYKAGIWMRPGPGVERVVVEIESDESGSWDRTAASFVRNTGGLPQEWVQVVAEESSARSGRRRVKFSFHGAQLVQVKNPIPAGSVSYVDGAVLTDAQSPADFFDGSTTVAGHTTNWTGAVNASSSELWTVPADADDTLAVPFGVMRLSASTVQGATEVNVAGDADAEAVLIIDGPGEDLEVINETTGQRIFVSGEIDETLTIDSRGGWQDIYSDSMRDGEWWARVDADAPEELITLRPGVNRIRVTMVNAHPSSQVRLLYRETYRAGH